MPRRCPLSREGPPLSRLQPLLLSRESRSLCPAFLWVPGNRVVAQVKRAGHAVRCTELDRPVKLPLRRRVGATGRSRDLDRPDTGNCDQIDALGALTTFRPGRPGSDDQETPRAGLITASAPCTDDGYAPLRVGPPQAALRPEVLRAAGQFAGRVVGHLRSPATGGAAG